MTGHVQQLWLNVNVVRLHSIYTALFSSQRTHLTTSTGLRKGLSGWPKVHGCVCAAAEVEDWKSMLVYSAAAISGTGKDVTNPLFNAVTTPLWFSFIIAQKPPPISCVLFNWRIHNGTYWLNLKQHNKKQSVGAELLLYLVTPELSAVVKLFPLKCIYSTDVSAAGMLQENHFKYHAKLTLIMCMCWIHSSIKF